MARFQYRMQNILNIKLKLEEQAKNDYAIARVKLNEEEDKLKKLQDRKIDYEEKNRKLLETKLKLKDIFENYRAIEVLKQLIKNQLVNIKKAEADLEVQRLRLQEVMQERKTHDKLKEKAFEEFVKEENSKESKEIDELTSYLYGKKIDRKGTEN
ncbi:MAG: flagellar export protein FliJ [Lachnospiraceae bacterium]|nr:flagellar export protein FliJ [Lachnospiraceae bacterium]